MDYSLNYFSKIPYPFKDFNKQQVHTQRPLNLYAGQEQNNKTYKNSNHKYYIMLLQVNNNNNHKYSMIIMTKWKIFDKNNKHF
jgi:hypothetical protein